MRGKRIKQINNWIIRYTEIYQYAVWSPDGRCYEDRLTLEQAENYCRENTDFVRSQKKGGKNNGKVHTKSIRKCR